MLFFVESEDRFLSWARRKSKVWGLFIEGKPYFTQYEKQFEEGKPDGDLPKGSRPGGQPESNYSPPSLVLLGCHMILLVFFAADPVIL